MIIIIKRHLIVENIVVCYRILPAALFSEIRANGRYSTHDGSRANADLATFGNLW